jgi:TorA maturation chaperone TorD
MNAHAAPTAAIQAARPEEQGRAEFYALLARLFYAGPDAGLLAAIAQADEIVSESERSALADAWRSLTSAAAAMDADAARLEYDALFVGTGKAPVTPYASHYLVTTGAEKVLVRLRDELASFGLSRRGDAREPEDHLAALFDVMRHLIVAGADEDALQTEKSFFDRYLRRAYGPFAAAVLAAESANFYRHVARFAKAFLDLEVESFDMLQS